MRSLDEEKRLNGVATVLKKEREKERKKEYKVETENGLYL